MPDEDLLRSKHSVLLLYPDLHVQCMAHLINKSSVHTRTCTMHIHAPLSRHLGAKMQFCHNLEGDKEALVGNQLRLH